MELVENTNTLDSTFPTQNLEELSWNCPGTPIPRGLALLVLEGTVQAAKREKQLIALSTFKLYKPQWRLAQQAWGPNPNNISTATTEPQHLRLRENLGRTVERL